MANLESDMRIITSIALASALAISVSGSANAGWGKWWKQVQDEKCWQKIFKNDAYVQQNCKA